MLTRRSHPVRHCRLALAGLLVVSAVSPVLAAEDRSSGGAAAQPLQPAVPRDDNRDHAAAGAGWWSIFRDPGLEALMTRLHSTNPAMAQAVAKLAMVRADARMTTAAGLPTLGLDASAAHAAGPLVNAAGQSGNLYTARATASWELDLLGRITDESRAARHEVEAAAASLADVTLAMETATARAWFARQSAARSAADAALAAQTARELLRIAETRAGLGLVDPGAVDAARERARKADLRLSGLELVRDSAGRQLSYLTGADASALDGAARLPEPPDVPADLSAELLSRRPDLRAARARVAAADARLSAIRKGWLPPITLTAARGQASSTLSQLFASAGGVFALGALLAIPVFDGGRHKASVAHGQAERNLSEAAYRERVAGALRDAYDGIQTAQAQRAALDAAREDSREAEIQLDRATARQVNGTISRAQLLEIRLRAFDRRALTTLAQGESLASIVALQAAFGGSLN